ncbi:hypothetical protein [Thiocystis violacea]|uniref:hypothetical protein n=1 Tax=Thiocystis violacea TaxID=13725 RepID=UPI001907E16B|nr:hypothetical protein [Thiocystis violacea]MBK1720357.1 hypothetical protein [Thiocystis violacea]
MSDKETAVESMGFGDATQAQDGDGRAALLAALLIPSPDEQIKPSAEEALQLQHDYGLTHVGVDTLRYGIAMAVHRYHHARIVITPKKASQRLEKIQQHIEALLDLFPPFFFGPIPIETKLADGIDKQGFIDALFRLNINADVMRAELAPYIDPSKKQQPHTGERLEVLLATLSVIFSNAANRLHAAYTQDPIDGRYTGEFVDFVVSVCQMTGIKKARSTIGDAIKALHGKSRIPAHPADINQSIPL